MTGGQLRYLDADSRRLFRQLVPEGVAALTGLGAAAYVAGGAWSGGFPVNDAWIHMVYGLELARHGALAYNDGISATGATSPLWALFAALSHLAVGARGPSMAAATALKVFGALAHAASSALAARCGRLAALGTGVAPVLGLVAGLIVATCPLLAYAAVSGMEVSLTGALLLAALLGAARGRTALAGVATGLAFLARPESAVIAPVVLALVALRAPRPWLGAWRAAAAGAIASAFAAALFARNEIVSGRPLPATFYVKAAPVSGRIMLQIRMERGFGDVLGGVAPTSSRLFWAFALVAILAAAGAGVGALARSAWRGRSLSALLLGGGAALAGLAYAAVVSWVVRVQSADAFYFQRYFAPSIPLLIVGATSGASTAATFVATALRGLRGRLRLRALLGASVALGACAVTGEARGLPSLPERYRREVADIDEVDVALGRFLARAVPRGAVVWSMNAGGERYWGQRFVVDLGKLNTPELFAGGEVRRGYDADVIVALDGPVHLVAGERTLEQVFAVRAPSWPPPPDAPAQSQVVWRCRGGVPEDEAGVDIVGYPERRWGRCKAH